MPHGVVSVPNAVYGMQGGRRAGMNGNAGFHRRGVCFLNHEGHKEREDNIFGSTRILVIPKISKISLPLKGKGICSDSIVSIILRRSLLSSFGCAYSSQKSVLSHIFLLTIFATFVRFGVETQFGCGQQAALCVYGGR
ncbi:MAG: hypothetical protein NTZ78_14435 [Candidatus Aureabacteria bacterium]|nr:hypothetical protein [Candidatus Auribacterota bacterium]